MIDPKPRGNHKDLREGGSEEAPTLAAQWNSLRKCAFGKLVIKELGFRVEV